MSTPSFSAGKENAFESSLLYSVAPDAAASQLGARAVQALIDEADLTPKPALVDRRGPGAHSDLTLALMHRSARSLASCFKAIATASAGKVPSQVLRERLGAIGRMGEWRMLAATHGANSHKGAIWSLGLLVAGAVLCADPADPFAVASVAASIACFPDSYSAPAVTHGARVQQMYGVSGARGEAQRGFPHVVHVGYPALLTARLRGVPEKWARLDALMAIMAQLDDTCLLHRGGLRAMRAAQRGAQCVLDEGGTSTSRGLARLLELDAELVGMNASPGGSADLLAATLFLDSITCPRDVRGSARVSLGDAESWKN
jgi:triphosphoribosyl-dephospho-CoA synthase